MELSRRRFLALGAMAAVGAQLRTPIALAAGSGGHTNPVAVENSLRGSNRWAIPWPKHKVATDRDRRIKGFASATSVAAGDTLTLFVTTTPAAPFHVDIFRLGWYGGAGGRHLARLGPFPGIVQPAHTVDRPTGMVSCPWEPSVHLTIPPDWVSGIYLAVLTTSSMFQNHVVFTVRDDTRASDLVFQQAVTTYQAYNVYPNDGKTGRSMYRGWGAPTVAGARAVKVSFDRPYQDAGNGQLLRWELPFLRWLEREGYDVTYCTDLDTHVSGDHLLGHRGLLSVGHDEYWSDEMVEAVTRARDAGVGVGFFGANAAYWRVRFEPSAAGGSDRVMTCYKSAKLDPAGPSGATVLFRDLGRAEQRLIGVQYTALLPSNFPYVVTNADHWVYEGTGLREGQSLPNLVGYESDRRDGRAPDPDGGSWALLSRSPVKTTKGKADFSNSSIYQAPSGAWVFGAGTLSWAWGLDRYGNGGRAVHPAIQRATANILHKMIAGGPPPAPSPA